LSQTKMHPTKEHLKELISQPGLSGFESPIREVIRAAWQPLVDEISVSPLGSLHGLRRAVIAHSKPAPAILLAAHMDAIGLMVSALEQGFLRVTEIGGIDPRIMPGQLVTVHGTRNLPAVVTCLPDRLRPHSKENTQPALEDLLVDTGLSQRELEKIVRVGDPVSFAQMPIELGESMIAGHTMDNRASVAAVTHCLRELQHIQYRWDVWAAATTQEEETLAGAFTSPFMIRPAIAVAVDVTFGRMPGVSDYRSFPLGKGPTIGLGPNIHPALQKRFKKLAEELDIPFAIEIMPQHSGTDAYAMQVVAEGIPTAVISIPVRNMHTPVECGVIKDIERAGYLLAQFIARLEPTPQEIFAEEEQE
jgi:tetrahedral aminopeptidase